MDLGSSLDLGSSQSVAALLAQLRFVTIGMGTFPIPENLAVSRMHDSFKEDGTPNDPAYEKRAAAFLDEVLWFAEAISDRKAKEKRRP